METGMVEIPSAHSAHRGRDLFPHLWTLEFAGRRKFGHSHSVFVSMELPLCNWQSASIKSIR